MKDNKKFGSYSSIIILWICIGLVLMVGSYIILYGLMPDTFQAEVVYELNQKEKFLTEAVKNYEKYINDLNKQSKDSYELRLVNGKISGLRQRQLEMLSDAGINANEIPVDDNLFFYSDYLDEATKPLFMELHAEYNEKLIEASDLEANLSHYELESDEYRQAALQNLYFAVNGEILGSSKQAESDRTESKINKEFLSNDIDIDTCFSMRNSGSSGYVVDSSRIIFAMSGTDEYYYEDWYFIGFINVDAYLSNDDLRYLQKLKDNETKYQLRMKGGYIKGMEFSPYRIEVIVNGDIVRTILNSSQVVYSTGATSSSYDGPCYIANVDGFDWIPSNNYNRTERAISKVSGFKGKLPYVKYGRTEGQYASVATNKSDGSNYYIICASDTLWVFWKQVLVVWAVIWAVILLLMLITVLERRKTLKQVEFQMNVNNALAHDLNSSLMVVSGYAENLHADVSPEKREHYTEEIRNTTGFMHSMILKMLTFARVDKKTQRESFEQVDLRELSESIVSRHAGGLEEKNLRVKIRGNLEVKAVKMLMDVVIDNFVDNAIKYGLPDSDIKIIMHGKRFEISNDWEVDEAVIKNPEGLWDPYAKADKARTAPKGNGLGLSISKKIFKMHKFKHGTIAGLDRMTFWFEAK